jgi:hypothetical protein
MHQSTMKNLFFFLLAALILGSCRPSTPRTSQINRKACKADHVNEVIGDSGRVVIPSIFSPDLDGFNDFLPFPFIYPMPP